MTYTKRAIQHLEVMEQYDIVGASKGKKVFPFISKSGKKISELAFDHSIAFQPIINIPDKTIYGYEALVRGTNNEEENFVLSQLNDSNRFQFDQANKIKAIQMAKSLAYRAC